MLSVKEFISLQSEFTPNQVKFTVDGEPLTLANIEELGIKMVIGWGMHNVGVINLLTGLL